MNDTKKIISKITDNIENLDKNTFYFNFFVFDTKGTPNSTLSYIYQIASELYDAGYRVRMLHIEEDFFGVESWLGEKYAKIPHVNAEKDGITMSPSDFLFIPELFSNVMYKVKDVPCKKIAILTNFNYLTEIIQPGATWLDYNIMDCITTSENLANRVKEIFPFVRTQVISPLISNEFKCDNEAKKLVVNVFGNVNNVVKPFFWKNPIFKWVSFRDIKGLSQEDLATVLAESFCSVWTDTDTDFGITALQAMASGNIVIGKIPDNIPEWMWDDNTFSENGIWFDNVNDCHKLIASVIEGFISNNDFSDIKKNMADTVSRYNNEHFTKNVKDVFAFFINNRKKEFNEVLAIANGKLNNEK